MKASDVCSSDLATVTPESSLAEAIRCMGNHNISALPVVDRDVELHGLISEGDFFRKATDSFRLDSLFDAGREVRRDALDSTRVGELMSTELVTVDGDVSLTDAIEIGRAHV